MMSCPPDSLSQLLRRSNHVHTVTLPSTVSLVTRLAIERTHAPL